MSWSRKACAWCQFGISLSTIRPPRGTVRWLLLLVLAVHIASRLSSADARDDAAAVAGGAVAEGATRGSGCEVGEASMDDAAAGYPGARTCKAAATDSSAHPADTVRDVDPTAAASSPAAHKHTASAGTCAGECGSTAAANDGTEEAAGDSNACVSSSTLTVAALNSSLTSTASPEGSSAAELVLSAVNAVRAAVEAERIALARLQETVAEQSARLERMERLLAELAGRRAEGARPGDWGLGAIGGGIGGLRQGGGDSGRGDAGIGGVGGVGGIDGMGGVKDAVPLGSMGGSAEGERMWKSAEGAGGAESRGREVVEERAGVRTGRWSEPLTWTGSLELVGTAAMGARVTALLLLPLDLSSPTGGRLVAVGDMAGHVRVFSSQGHLLLHLHPPSLHSHEHAHAHDHGGRGGGGGAPGGGGGGGGRGGEWAVTALVAAAVKRNETWLATGHADGSVYLVRVPELQARGRSAAAPATTTTTITAASAAAAAAAAVGEHGEVLVGGMLASYAVPVVELLPAGALHSLPAAAAAAGQTAGAAGDAQTEQQQQQQQAGWRVPWRAVTCLEVHKSGSSRYILVGSAGGVIAVLRSNGSIYGHATMPPVQQGVQGLQGMQHEGSTGEARSKQRGGEAAAAAAAAAAADAAGAGVKAREKGPGKGSLDSAEATAPFAAAAAAAVGRPSVPLAFIRTPSSQRVLFLTSAGAASVDLLSLTMHPATCHGLNGSTLAAFSFDPASRSRAYAVTTEGELVLVTITGDTNWFDCRVRWRVPALHSIKPAAAAADVGVDVDPNADANDGAVDGVGGRDSAESAGGRGVVGDVVGVGQGKVAAVHGYVFVAGAGSLLIFNVSGQFHCNDVNTNHSFQHSFMPFRPIPASHSSILTVSHPPSSCPLLQPFRFVSPRSKPWAPTLLLTIPLSSALAALPPHLPSIPPSLLSALASSALPPPLIASNKESLLAVAFSAHNVAIYRSRLPVSSARSRRSSSFLSTPILLIFIFLCAAWQFGRRAHAGSSAGGEALGNSVPGDSEPLGVAPHALGTGLGIRGLEMDESGFAGGGSGAGGSGSGGGGSGSAGRLSAGSGLFTGRRTGGGGDGEEMWGMQMGGRGGGAGGGGAGAGGDGEVARANVGGRRPEEGSAGLRIHGMRPSGGDGFRGLSDGGGSGGVAEGVAGLQRGGGDRGGGGMGESGGDTMRENRLGFDRMGQARGMAAAGVRGASRLGLGMEEGGEDTRSAAGTAGAATAAAAAAGVGASGVGGGAAGLSAAGGGGLEGASRQAWLDASDGGGGLVSSRNSDWAPIGRMRASEMRAAERYPASHLMGGRPAPMSGRVVGHPGPRPEYRGRETYPPSGRRDPFYARRAFQPG
ncbi:unnamed protein product [Closterium sp. Naga37s-1]|nr:unnamed protein product [Closterium sp. Naga37s-1]